jgi:hypothetical protein
MLLRVSTAPRVDTINIGYAYSYGTSISTVSTIEHVFTIGHEHSSSALEMLTTVCSDTGHGGLSTFRCRHMTLVASYVALGHERLFASLQDIIF